MKKLAIIGLLAVAFSASAVDLSVRASNPSGAETYRLGVAASQNFGKYNVEGALDMSAIGTTHVNRYSVTGSYQLAKIGPVAIAPKLGVAYVHPGVGPTGLVATAGVGASYAINKNLSLVADYTWQNGQQRVNWADNNVVSAGLKYTF